MSLSRLALLLAYLLVGMHANAQAQADTLLFPSAAARAQREAGQASKQLERSLLLLPGVSAARVQLDLPALDTHPLDEPVPKARMSVVLQLEGLGPNDDDVRRLAIATLRRPLEQPIVIVRAPSPTTKLAHEGTAKVGPFVVLVSSAGPLRATLASCLMANVFLATLLLLERKRRGRRKQQN